MLAKQIAIGLGIAVIFPLLVYHGVRTFYPPPVLSSVVVAERAEGQNAKERQASEQKRRDQERDHAAKTQAFTRVLAFVAAPLGIAAILGGAYLANVVIGTGLILGGVITVAHGYWGYWNYAEDWLRFVALLVALIVLVFVGYFRIGSRGVSRASEA
jgi:hypothetical protein